MTARVSNLYESELNILESVIDAKGDLFTDGKNESIKVTLKALKRGKIIAV